VRREVIITSPVSPLWQGGEENGVLFPVFSVDSASSAVNFDKGELYFILGYCQMCLEEK